MPKQRLAHSIFLAALLLLCGATRATQQDSTAPDTSITSINDAATATQSRVSPASDTSFVVNGLPKTVEMCGCSSCTDEVLSSMASDHSGTHSCRTRMDWLQAMGLVANQHEACVQVAHFEFPDVCGACDPTTCEKQPPTATRCFCPACQEDILSRQATDASGTFSCGSRIDWLIEHGAAEEDACLQVSSVEFPNICGPQCDPTQCQDPIQQPAPAPQPTPMPFNSQIIHYSESPSQAPTEEPTSMPAFSNENGFSAEPSQSPTFESTIDCGCSSTCTMDVLQSVTTDYSGDYTCVARMDWLRSEIGLSEREACIEIAGVQFHHICGGCNPIQCNPGKTFTLILGA